MRNIGFSDAVKMWTDISKKYKKSYGKRLDEVNDHIFIFTKKIDGRELRMYVTQPYNNVDELYENVKEWCEKHGLSYVIYDEGDAFLASWSDDGSCHDKRYERFLSG